MIFPFLIGIGIMFVQIATGINAVIYYTPTIFKEIGINSNQEVLLITIFIGLINFLMTFVATIFVDKIGRKPLIYLGLSGMLISLIIIAMLLLLVEIVLLPGVSVAGIGAIISYAIAVYKAFIEYDSEGGWLVLVIAIISAIATIAIAVKGNIWQRFSLKDNIDSRSQTPAEEQNIERGARGTAITRLAPSGKVMVDGKVFEARSIDAYIDQRTEIEVIDFENFTLIVRKAKTE